MNFDISLLDTDPLVRGDMVNGLRLFHEDYPAGIRFRAALGSVGVPGLLGMTMLVIKNQKVIINPEFAPFIKGKHDQSYVDAIKGWVAYSSMVDEVDAALGKGST